MPLFAIARALTWMALLSLATPGAAQGSAASPTALPTASDEWNLGPWERLPTEAYRGKQDDIVFVDPDTGWYVNGAGKLYATTDGGRSWEQRIEQPGTFFRCVGFLDSKHGFVGNVGTEYFPNVTDETPLYRTRDGAETLEPVEGIDAPGLKGLCAIQVVRYPFINAGVAGEKTLVVAAGRVGGPAWLLLSQDRGETWRSHDLSAHCGMILDVHFFTDQIGLVAAATSTDVSESNALILRTEDGGSTWSPVYTSDRAFELTWKLHFPTRNTGFCTVQSYNPDPAADARFVVKSQDGGRSWIELPLVQDHAVRPFGVAFIDEHVGWVGAMPNGFATRDGGASWAPATFGNAVNKIRVIPIDESGASQPMSFRAFAIGVEVHRLDAERATKAPR